MQKYTSLKPHPHQQRVIDNNPSKAILAHEMRTGKSLIACYWIDHSCRVGNTYIISPKQIKKDWVKMGTQATVLSKEEFKKAWNNGEIERPTAVVVDECFVAGTEVLTDSGYKKIEEIKTGDVVVNAQSSGRVYHLGSRVSHKILNVKIKNGKSFKVTLDHPFLTQRGWVKAKKLTQSDVLLHYLSSHNIINNYDLSSMQKSLQGKKIRLSFLQKELCKEVSQHKENPRFTEKTPPKMLVWKRCSHRLQWKNIKNMLLWTCNIFGSENKSPELGLRDERIFKENEGAQSHERSRDTKESISHTKINWSQAKGPWRERKTDDCSSKNFARSTWGWLVRRARSCYWGGLFAKSLQNRYSQSKKENSDRSGWEFSRAAFSEKTRQTQGLFPEELRVESVEVEKQRGVRVYNLGVEGHPSYVINDCVVHNCHYFASPLFVKGRSQMAAALYELVREYPNCHMLLLTATPIRQNAWSLHTLLCYIGEYYDWKAWREEFFHLEEAHFLKNIPGKWTPDKIWMPHPDWRINIRHYLEKHCDILSLKDIVDHLPPITNEIIKVKQKPYERPVDEIVTWTHEHQYEQTNKHKEILKLGFKKLIVVAHYTAQIDLLKEELSAEKPVFVLDGRTKDADDTKRQAQEADECYFIVQASMGFGFDGYMFGAIVFASMSHSCVHYTQMSGRLRHLKHLTPVSHYFLIGGRWDQRILDTIEAGKDFNPHIYRDEMV